jgi:hypothetical protein
MLHVERVMNEGTARRNSARLASSAGAGHPGLDRIRWTFRGRSRSADEAEIDEQHAALAALGADDGKVESWLLEAIQNDEERERERAVQQERHGSRSIADDGSWTVEAHGREHLERIAVAIRTLARAAAVMQTAAALTSEVMPPQQAIPVVEARRYVMPDEEEPESESLPMGTGLDEISGVDATPNPRPRVQDFEEDAVAEAPLCAVDSESVLLAAVGKMDRVEQALLDIGQYATTLRDELGSSRNRATAAAEAASDAEVEVADLRGALQSLRDVAIRSDEENDRIIAELQEKLDKERATCREWEAAAMSWRSLLSQLQPDAELLDTPVHDQALASVVVEAFSRSDVLADELRDRVVILNSAHSRLAVDVSALEADLLALDETLAGQMDGADVAAAESNALEMKCSELKAALAASERKKTELEAALRDAAEDTSEAVSARDDAIDRANMADDRIAELEDEVARLTRALARSRQAGASVSTKPIGVSCDLLLPPGVVSAWAEWRLPLDGVPNSEALVSRFALTVLPTANQPAEPFGSPLQPLIADLEASMSGSMTASGTFRGGRSITMEVAVLSGQLLFFAAQSGSPRSPRRTVLFDSVISVTREGLSGLKIVSSDAGTIQGQLQSPLLREAAYELCHLVFSMSGRRHVHAPSLGAPSGGDRFRTVFDTGSCESNNILCTTHTNGSDGEIAAAIDTYEARTLAELNAAARFAAEHSGDGLIGVAASRHAFQETDVLIASAKNAAAAASLVDKAEADVFVLFVEAGACDVGFELRQAKRSRECAVVATIDAVPGSSGAGVAVVAAGADEVAGISDVSMEAADGYVVVTFAFHETLFACCAATKALEDHASLLSSLLAADHGFVLLNDAGAESPIAIEPVTFAAVTTHCTPVGRLVCSAAASDGSPWSTRLSRRRVQAAQSGAAVSVLSVPTRRVSCRLFERHGPTGTGQNGTMVPQRLEVHLEVFLPHLAATLDASNVRSLARGSGQTAWVVDAQARNSPSATHFSIVLGSAMPAALMGPHEVHVLGLFDREQRDLLRMIVRVRPLSLPSGGADLTALVLSNDTTPVWSAADGSVVTCTVTRST